MALRLHSALRDPPSHYRKMTFGRDFAPVGRRLDKRCFFRYPTHKCCLLRSLAPWPGEHCVAEYYAGGLAADTPADSVVAAGNEAGGGDAPQRHGGAVLNVEPPGAGVPEQN